MMISTGDMQRLIDRQAVGRRLRALREAKGWRAIDLAAKSGVDDSVIWMIERGERRGSILCIAALALALGRPLEWILSGHRSLKTAWTRLGTTQSSN